jgi:uncharacterized protein (DUF433 family)
VKAARIRRAFCEEQWMEIKYSGLSEYLIMRDTLFVSSAEAAFVGELTDRQINRVVDEGLVPARLLVQAGARRQFARLAAAFARFYLDMEDTLAVAARRRVLAVLDQRLQHLDAARQDRVLRLDELPHDLDWTVAMPGVVVDVAPFVVHAFARAREVDSADALVSSDAEIMNGTPCFRGTRVPIEGVLASLDEGVSLQRLQGSYPFLTPAHAEAARVYLHVHPRRGRPRRLGQTDPSLRTASSRVVRPAAR